MTGTGMLTDCAEGPLGLPYEIFKWALVAKVCGLQLFFVSVGAEPIRRCLTRLLIRSSLRVADYVCFRDGHSQAYMTEMGFRGSSVVSPDLAFSLPERILPRRRALGSRKPVIGHGFFDYEGRGVGGPDRKNLYADYIGKLSAFVSWLVGHGYPVRILIGDMRYDDPVRHDLRNSLDALGIRYDVSAILDEPIASATNLIDQIAGADIVVATRYHNVVLALMLHKPVISISYERKNESLMGDLGLSDYCQRIDRLDVARLKDQFLLVEQNANALATQIANGITGYRKALADQYTRLFKPERILRRASLSSHPCK
jgi:polysaccharide pyruvyl transferase WcaK-like protein